MIHRRRPQRRPSSGRIRTVMPRCFWPLTLATRTSPLSHQNCHLVISRSLPRTGRPAKVLFDSWKTFGAIKLPIAWCDLYFFRGISGTFCEPKFGNFDGNGPRPGERCETKWRIFAKIHPNVRLEGPGTEQNFRFGSGWSVRVCPCGHVLRQFGIAGRCINFCSFCLFFSYVIIFEIVELYSVDFVFSSMFSSSELQAITKPSISPSHSVVRKPEKVYFVRTGRRQRERGEERRRHESST